MLIATACLAGCTAGASSVAPEQQFPGGPGPLGTMSLAAVRPDANHYEDDVVYSSQPYGNNATVYKRKGTTLTPVKTISGGIAAPQGTVATPNGWWYLTNAGDSDVLIYRPTKKGPRSFGRLEDPGEIPVNIDVSPERQLVAVSNGTSASSGTGSVSVYSSGGSQPSQILTYGSDPVQGQGIAIDPSGNCFWSFDDLSKPSSAGAIVEFSGCSGTGTLVISGITSAGGLTFDRNGNLYYIDEANGIYKCVGIARCTAFPARFGLPTNLNFDAKEKHLWVADATGYLDAVDPNSGTIQRQTLSIDGDPNGIAPAPGD